MSVNVLPVMPLAMLAQVPPATEGLLQTEKEYDPVGEALQFSVTELPLLLTLVILIAAGTDGVPRMKLPADTGKV